MKKNISWNLTILICFIVLIFQVIIYQYISNDLEKNLTKDTNNKFSLLLDSHKKTLDNYFNSIKNDLILLAENKQIIDAFNDFSNGWNQLPEINRTEYLQNLYINKNPNSINQKMLLNRAEDNSYYSDIHAKFHPWFKNFIKLKGYYDLLIVNLEGDVIYTTSKETDFATNLISGKWQDTSLAEIFKNSKNKNKLAEISFSDFVFYKPSRKTAASFIATPIFNGNQKLGILIVQTSTEKITQVMQSSLGLGDDGQIFLVGKDKLLRSNMLNNNDILTTKFDFPIINKAIEGKNGNELININNKEYISFYENVNFNNINWAIISIQPKSELYKNIKKIKHQLLSIFILGMIIFSVIIYCLIEKITRPLKKLIIKVKNISQGDYDIIIPNLDKENEIGDLARAINILREESKTKNDLEINNNKLININKQTQTEFVSLVTKSFKDKIYKFLEDIKSAAGILASVSNKMHSLINENNGALNNAVTTANKSSYNIQNLSNSANILATTIQDIVQKSFQSNKFISEASMKAQNADKNTLMLTDATQNISDVVEMINNIAGQINLLALNATIESARAGEAGKGFGVVATEVKNLASQTAKATEDITSKIQEMNDVSSNVVNALIDIKSYVQNVNQSSELIFKAIEQQNLVTNEITNNMKTISKGSSEIDTSLKNALESSEELDSNAKEMLDLSTKIFDQLNTIDVEIEKFLNDIKNN